MDWRWTIDKWLHDHAEKPEWLRRLWRPFCDRLRFALSIRDDLSWYETHDIYADTEMREALRVSIAQANAGQTRKWRDIRDELDAE